MSHSVAKNIDFLPLRFSLAWTSRACDSFQFSYRRGCGFELGQWMLGGCWEEGDFCRVHKARWELSCREQSWMSEQLCEAAGSILGWFGWSWNQKITWLPFPEVKVNCSGLHPGESWEGKFCWRKIKQHQEWENELCKGCASVTQMPYL